MVEGIVTAVDVVVGVFESALDAVIRAGTRSTPCSNSRKGRRVVGLGEARVVGAGVSASRVDSGDVD